MSIRPEEVQQEASRFSLADYIGGGSAPRATSSPQTAQPPQQQQLPQRAPGAFGFQIGRVPTNTVVTHTNQPFAAQAMAPFSDSRPPTKLSFSLSMPPAKTMQPESRPVSTTPLPNLTFALHSMRGAKPPAQGSAPAVSANGVSGAAAVAADVAPPSSAVLSIAAQRVGDPGSEVMRLTALLEESKTKLSRTTARLTATEASVARANQSLTSERAAAAARVVQLTNELRASREIETKLRAEIANSPHKADLARHDEAFRIQAEGAVQLEQAHEDLQKRFDETDELHTQAAEALRVLRDEHAALTAEHEKVCTALGTTKARLESMEACAGTPEPTASEQSIEEATAKLRLEMDQERTAAVEKALQEATAVHAEKVDALEKTQSTLEDLLITAAGDIKAAQAARDEALKRLEDSKVAAAKVAATSEGHADLPEHARAALESYASEHARFLELQALASDIPEDQMKLEAARHRVQSLYDQFATGSAPAAPRVTSARSDSELLASMRGGRARSYFDAVLPARTASLNAAVQFNGHSATSAVLISPSNKHANTGCLPGLYDDDADPHSDTHSDSSSDADMADVTGAQTGADATANHILSTQPVRPASPPRHDLRKQEGRIAAAVEHISSDLKSMFKVRKKRYTQASEIEG